MFERLMLLRRLHRQMLSLFELVGIEVKGRVAKTAAAIQRALSQQGTLQPHDMFPEACLAASQVVPRGRQGAVPACSVPSCRSLRASTCQHFKCNGWWCNKH
eukprot:5128971-Amphidinium_carterae.1